METQFESVNAPVPYLSGEPGRLPDSPPAHRDATAALRFESNDCARSQTLAVAIADPDLERRKSVSDAVARPRMSDVREITAYLAGIEEARWLSEQGFDAVFVGLDADPEAALRMVESLCFLGRVTVMVYSEQESKELLMRSMRAGAREFLTLPLDAAAISEALERVAGRAQTKPAPPKKKAAGQSIVFLGAKGGAGVTTVACNFAVSLAQDSHQRVLLIDLNLPLGDAGLNLGVAADHSTINALEQSDRLDPTFLSQLLARHHSGLWVLAAPGQFSPFHVVDAAIDHLLAVAVRDFDYVVVDAGSHLGATGQALFDEGTSVYLVTQVGIPDLRNSNRIVSELLSKSGTKVQVVLNRYTPRSLVIDEENITKALTMPARWKIPNDEPSARSAQNTAVPLVLKDSPASRVIREMVRETHGTTEKPEKKKRFSLFG